MTIATHGPQRPRSTERTLMTDGDAGELVFQAHVDVVGARA